MDAQIMKRFFQDMFEDVTVTEKTKEGNEAIGFKRLAKIKRTDIPTKWISSARGIADKQDQCDYLDQFWTKRWADKKENASTYNPSSDHRRHHSPSGKGPQQLAKGTNLFLGFFELLLTILA